MSKFNKILENMWERYSNDLAKILIYTGITGWALSSSAQILALLFNDKISTKEKTFLIPQETFDAAVNIASFTLITTGIKNLATKLVTTGKIAPKSLRAYLNNSPFKDSIGTLGFNIEKELKPLASFSEHEKSYNAFKNIFVTGATIGGSITSSNIVTPILRNNLASISHHAIVKNTNEGKNSIFTKEDLESKKAPTIKYQPKINLYQNVKTGMKI